MSRRLTSVILASALTALTLLTIPTFSFAGPKYPAGWHMHHQQGRIYQGVRQGQSGPREYRYLNRTTEDSYTSSLTVGHFPARPERSAAESKGGESGPSHASTSPFGLRSA